MSDLVSLGTLAHTYNNTRTCTHAHAHKLRYRMLETESQLLNNDCARVQVPIETIMSDLKLLMDAGKIKAVGKLRTLIV